MQDEFSQNIGPTFDDMTTSGPGRNQIPNGSTSSPEASLARTSVTPAKASASMDSGAGCSSNSCESFAFFDRASSSWKTFQRCFLEGWESFSDHWPAMGSMRNGVVSLQGMLVRPTSASEYSSSPPQFPTMTVTTANHPGRTKGKKGQQVSLSMVVNTGLDMRSIKRGANFPTPKASDGDRGELLALVRGKKTRQKWIPMPTAGDARSSRNSTAKRNKIPPTGVHAGDTLTDFVTLWPTPNARDWKSGKVSEATLERNSRPLSEAAANGQTSGQLNPTWVEWLMGFPLGWTDLEGSETP